MKDFGEVVKTFSGFRQYVVEILGDKIEPNSKALIANTGYEDGTELCTLFHHYETLIQYVRDGEANEGEVLNSDITYEVELLADIIEAALVDTNAFVMNSPIYYATVEEIKARIVANCKKTA